MYKYKKLVIEEGCTASFLSTNNGDYGVFSGCTGLKGKIVIPSTFGDIGDRSFYKCTGIEGIEIKSNRITKIGNHAFYNCTNLKGDLTIPNSVTTIGNNAFWGCSNLDGKLKMSNSVVTIGYTAFGHCEKLKGDLVIPGSATTIGMGAFCGCSSLESLTIEEGCTASFGHNGGQCATFLNCTGLKGTVIIPSTFGNIGEFSFKNCTNLEKIVVKNKTSTIYNSVSTFHSTIKLSGYAGSTIEEYAKKYNRTFEAIQ